VRPCERHVRVGIAVDADGAHHLQELRKHHLVLVPRVVPVVAVAVLHGTKDDIEVVLGKGTQALQIESKVWKRFIMCQYQAASTQVIRLAAAPDPTWSMPLPSRLHAFNISMISLKFMKQGHTW
jgi:hypothetical protein